MKTVATMSAAGIAGLAGCSGAENTDVADGEPADAANNAEGADTTEGANPTAEGTQVPDVTIDSHELFEGTFGNAEIRGEVTNTSGEEQSYIEMAGKFFDDADTRIGTTSWNATDVPADQTIAFETVMSTTAYDDVARYEITSSTSAF